MGNQEPTQKTLAETRTYISARIHKGVKCPACGQFAKVYKRKIHSTMSRMLIALSKLGPGYHHITEIMSVRNGWGDFAKLTYWGLIETMPDNGWTAGKTTGYWRITEKGEQFVHGAFLLPKYALVYNKKLLGFNDKESVNIRDTLGNKFVYKELMTAV